jgi:hypothetical protein
MGAAGRDRVEHVFDFSRLPDLSTYPETEPPVVDRDRLAFVASREGAEDVQRGDAKGVAGR